MKVVYRHYESDQGLEEIQAKIFTEVSGLPATAEEIRERNTRRDPKTTRYALTEDGKPLAYVTARDSNSERGRTYIGYPWKMPDCPAEAQEKIFSELMEYLDEREETHEIGTTIVVGSKIAAKQREYFENKGFEERTRLYFYNLDFDVETASTWNLSDDANSFSSKIATIEDIDTIVDVFHADPYMKNVFPDDDALRNYLEHRVLKDGHAVLIMKGDLGIAASAALKMEPDGVHLTTDDERIIMRFSAARPDHPGSWKRLISEIAKECVSAGWENIPLRIRTHFMTGNPAAIPIAEIQPELELFELILVQRKE